MPEEGVHGKRMLVFMKKESRQIRTHGLFCAAWGENGGLGVKSALLSQRKKMRARKEETMQSADGESPSTCMKDVDQKRAVAAAGGKKKWRWGLAIWRKATKGGGPS